MGRRRPALRRPYHLLDVREFAAGIEADDVNGFKSLVGDMRTEFEDSVFAKASNQRVSGMRHLPLWWQANREISSRRYWQAISKEKLTRLVSQRSGQLPQYSAGVGINYRPMRYQDTL
jgi:hypothetical protein